MTIKQLTQNGAVLKNVVCSRYDGSELNAVSVLTFLFKGGETLTLSVNPNTDEIALEMPEGAALKPIEPADAVPALASAYGLLLTWSWEMKNHQGYFDAVQLELTNQALTHTKVFQFKAAASNIEIYEVNQLPLPKIR